MAKRHLSDYLHNPGRMPTAWEPIVPKPATRFGRWIITIGATSAAFGWGMLWIAGAINAHALDSTAAVVLGIAHVVLAGAWIASDDRGYRARPAAVASVLVVCAWLFGIVDGASGAGFILVAMIPLGGCLAALRGFPIVRMFAVASAASMVLFVMALRTGMIAVPLFLIACASACIASFALVAAVSKQRSDAA
jgi:hypothetical protein